MKLSSIVILFPDQCCQWWGARILPYQKLCGTIIADYGVKTCNISQYLPLWLAQKPPRISAIAPPLWIFDNTAPIENNLFKIPNRF